MGRTHGREGKVVAGPPSRPFLEMHRAVHCDDQAGVLYVKCFSQSEHGVVSQFFLPRGPLVIRRVGSGCW
jgi:hypothetical protein